LVNCPKSAKILLTASYIQKCCASHGGGYKDENLQKKSLPEMLAVSEGRCNKQTQQQNESSDSKGFCHAS
jgi:acetoin utilization deacetylase AcuC-like enzyme